MMCSFHGDDLSGMGSGERVVVVTEDAGVFVFRSYCRLDIDALLKRGCSVTPVFLRRENLSSHRMAQRCSTEKLFFSCMRLVFVSTLDNPRSWLPRMSHIPREENQ